jgi:hypothetical protein
VDTTQNTTRITTRTPTRRGLAAIAVTAFVVGLGALPAAARQDAGSAHLGTDYPYFRTIQRVGSQYVAGDNLTGNGVPAPPWVPERG